MTGPTIDPESAQHRPEDRPGGGAGDSGSTVGAPRWVKVFGLIALAVAVLVVVLLLVGGGPGKHGPGRHQMSAGVGGHPPAVAARQAAWLS